MTTWLTYSTCVVFQPEAGTIKFNPVPSLQAYRHTEFSRTLDVENIQSILMAVRELQPAHNTGPESIKDVPSPGSNLVQFIFMVFQSAPETTSIPLHVEQGFFDLFCNENVNSKVRATSFLSLIWRYFETDTRSSPSIDPFKFSLSQSTAKLKSDIREDQDSQEEIDYAATLICRQMLHYRMCYD